VAKPLLGHAGHRHRHAPHLQRQLVCGLCKCQPADASCASAQAGIVEEALAVVIADGLECLRPIILQLLCREDLVHEPRCGATGVTAASGLDRRGDGGVIHAGRRTDGGAGDGVAHDRIRTPWRSPRWRRDRTGSSRCHIEVDVSHWELPGPFGSWSRPRSCSPWRRHPARNRRTVDAARPLLVHEPVRCAVLACRSRWHGRGFSGFRWKVGCDTGISYISHIQSAAHRPPLNSASP
jgi:hypothetical protein